MKPPIFIFLDALLLNHYAMIHSGRVVNFSINATDVKEEPRQTSKEFR